MMVISEQKIKVSELSNDLLSVSNTVKQRLTHLNIAKDE